MNYQNALEYLYSLERRGIKLGLRELGRALARVGNPHQKLRFVHVAGTNGKGSVASMLEASLRAAGHRTGLFTSPHLHRWVERIRIAGRPIPERAAARHITRVAEAFDGAGSPALSFFESTFVVALLAFVEARCDVVILEVGLGGRLDATNVVTPVLSVITPVSFDHQDYLGHTLRSIAKEKAGIIKRGVPVVVGEQEAPARKVIAARARALRSPARWFGKDFGVREAGRKAKAKAGLTLWGTAKLDHVVLGLAGAHQLGNAAVAWAAIEALRAQRIRLPDAAVRRGLRTVKWPGRLERKPGKPAFLFDAAHNPAGARVLAEYLAAHPAKGRRVLVFGAMADKDYGAMLRTLSPVFDAIVCTRPGTPRAAPPSALARVTGGKTARDSKQAITLARKLAGRDGEIVIAGTIFLVADIRAQLLGLAQDPLIRM